MIVGNMTDSSESLDANPIPQLSELRRAPLRYRHILPLTIMKRYQCIVVGAAKGKLTIAITDSQNMEVIESLSRYTGKTIFPVLIHPKRMQLLLQRIERREQCSGNFHPKRKRHFNRAGWSFHCDSHGDIPDHGHGYVHYKFSIRRIFSPSQRN